MVRPNQYTVYSGNRDGECTTAHLEEGETFALKSTDMWKRYGSNVGKSKDNKVMGSLKTKGYYGYGETIIVKKGTSKQMALRYWNDYRKTVMILVNKEAEIVKVYSNPKSARDDIQELRDIYEKRCSEYKGGISPVLPNQFKATECSNFYRLLDGSVLTWYSDQGKGGERGGFAYAVSKLGKKNKKKRKETSACPENFASFADKLRCPSNSAPVPVVGDEIQRSISDVQPRDSHQPNLVNKIIAGGGSASAAQKRYDERILGISAESKKRKRSDSSPSIDVTNTETTEKPSSSFNFNITDSETAEKHGYLNFTEL